MKTTKIAINGPGVAHKEFLTLNLKPFKKEIAVVYDVKGVLEQSDMKL